MFPAAVVARPPQAHPEGLFDLRVELGLLGRRQLAVQVAPREVALQQHADLRVRLDEFG